MFLFLWNLPNLVVALFRENFINLKIKRRLVFLTNYGFIPYKVVFYRILYFFIHPVLHNCVRRISRLFLYFLAQKRNKTLLWKYCENAFNVNSTILIYKNIARGVRIKGLSGKVKCLHRACSIPTSSRSVRFPYTGLAALPKLRQKFMKGFWHFLNQY